MPSKKSKKKRGKKKGSPLPLVIAAAAIGLALFFVSKKGSAGVPKDIPKGKGPGKAPPAGAPASARPAPELTAAPDPVPTGEAIDDAPAPTSSGDTGPSDPLKAAGWKWGFMGSVDPDEAWSVGEVISPSQLPFGADNLIQVSPLDTVEVAYYLASQEMLTPGYYVVGQINSEGFSFEPPFWGIIHVWQE